MLKGILFSLAGMFVLLVAFLLLTFSFNEKVITRELVIFSCFGYFLFTIGLYLILSCGIDQIFISIKKNKLEREKNKEILKNCGWNVDNPQKDSWRNLKLKNLDPNKKAISLYVRKITYNPIGPKAQLEKLQKDSR